MLDIVIPLNTQSVWEDNELRYCLRSIEKHLIGYGNVFIVGDFPDFIYNNPIDKDFLVFYGVKPHKIIHIPAKDAEGFGKRSLNIFNKIKLACEDSRVSEDFIFFNDDHYLLKTFQAKDFPYFHHGFLDGNRLQFQNGLSYRKQLDNTITYLHSVGARVLRDYDCHCPIVYNKSLFQKLPDFPAHGFAIKSLYCNLNDVESIYCLDLKFRYPMCRGEIYAALEGREWFSISDKSLWSGDMVNVLDEIYNEKSIYEL